MNTQNIHVIFIYVVLGNYCELEPETPVVACILLVLSDFQISGSNSQ